MSLLASLWPFGACVVSAEYICTCPVYSRHFLIFTDHKPSTKPKKGTVGTTRVAAILLEFPVPAAFVGGTTPLSRGIRQCAQRHKCHTRDAGRLSSRHG
jgi:hypothetical protein